MKTFVTILWMMMLLQPLFLRAEGKEVPFTLDDRDRLIRTEQKVESMRNEMNMRFESVDKRFESVDKRFDAIDKRFDAIDKRFDQLFSFLWAIIGTFTSIVISLIGFAFWDRKLAVRPVKIEQDKILHVLQDYAKQQPRLSEILKNAGLL
ncbi:MAG: hypothetical protein NTX61_07760 [Bacteroidetes bacterium]|nr:hypothetical protein [Bacteroidota bacterium]